MCVVCAQIFKCRCTEVYQGEYRNVKRIVMNVPSELTTLYQLLKLHAGNVRQPRRAVLSTTLLLHLFHLDM